MQLYHIAPAVGAKRNYSTLELGSSLYHMLEGYESKERGNREIKSEMGFLCYASSYVTMAEKNNWSKFIKDFVLEGLIWYS